MFCGTRIKEEPGVAGNLISGEENGGQSFIEEECLNPKDLYQSARISSDLGLGLEALKQKSKKMREQNADGLKCHCGYVGRCTYILNRHLITHQSDNEVTWHQCDRCSFKSKHKDSLRKHKKIIHTFSNDETPFDSIITKVKQEPGVGANLITAVENGDELFIKEECLDLEDVYEPETITSEDCDLKIHLEDLPCIIKQEPSDDTCLLSAKENGDESFIKEECLNPEEIYHTETVSSSEDCDFKMDLKEFEPENDLSSHSSEINLTTANAKKIKCHCGYVAKDKYALKRHSVIHQSDDEVTWHLCDLCSFKSKHKESLRKHKKNIHTFSDDEETPVDGILTKVKQEPGVVANLIIGEETQKQCHCGYVAKDNYALKRHSVTHQSDNEVKWYECDECSFKTKHSDGVRKHKKNVHTLYDEKRPIDGIYPCHNCEFTTKDPIAYSKHADQTHIFCCDICDFQTRQKKDLETHALTHITADEASMYKCPKCVFETKCSSSIHSHILTHFFPKSGLKRGMFETDEKTMATYKYKCGHCNFRGKTGYNVKRHELTHVRDDSKKKFICQFEDCNFRTANKHTLTRHSLHRFRWSRSPSESSDAFLGVVLLPESATASSKLPSVDSRYQICWSPAASHGVPISEKSRSSFFLGSPASLLYPVLIHKKDEEVTWYGCSMCSFKTRHKGSVKKHMISHNTEANRDPRSRANPVNFSCSYCPFNTKWKNFFERHLLVCEYAEDSD